MFGSREEGVVMFGSGTGVGGMFDAQLGEEFVCPVPSVKKMERRKAQPSMNDAQKNNVCAKSEKPERAKAQPIDKTTERGKGRQIIIGEIFSCPNAPG